MVTPLEMLHAAQVERARQQARAVQVYAPGRRLPVRQAPQRRAPAPVRNREQRRATGERGPGVDWSGFNERARNSPGAQKTREEAFNAEQAQAAEETTPWYKKGLGMVLGNPITKTAMLPLNFIDTGRRAAVYGVEKAGGLPDILQGPISALVDEERVAADDRSFREKVLKQDSDYGYGQLLDEDNPAWLNKALGFGGDVFLDPTSYVTGGATRLTGAGAKAAKLGEAATVTAKASKLTDDAARLVGKTDEFGVQEAFEAGLRKQAAEQEALARRLAADAAEMPLGRRVPLRQGRKARAEFIGELAEENPDLIRRFKPELERAGERGFNTIRDPELRELIGLGDPALRWMGMNIPGTERLVYGGARAGGWARQGANKAPLLGPTMAKFAPKGLEEPLGTLTRGKGGDTLRAATAVRLQNLMRRGAGNMEGRSNKLLTDLVRSPEWRKAGKDGVRRLTREAELDPSPNSLNKFFGHDIPALYNEVAGRPMDVKRNADTYIPHMHTPGGKRFLRDNVDPKVLEKDMGFVVDDLLEGSKFLEKSRKLTPDTVGVPKEFRIGDRGTITLTDGTIDELNDELGRLFPEFKGKFYEDDPVKIGESYISSVARQAGRDFGVDRLAASGNPLVQDITGELADAIEARNTWARSNPVTEMVKKGYTAGQRVVPAGQRGPKPTSKFDPMLAETLHEAETQAQRDLMYKEGKTFINDVKGDTLAIRTRLGESLKTLRSTLMEGLSKKEKKAATDIKLLNSTLKKVSDDVKALGPLTTENMDEMVVIQHSLELKKVQTKAEIKRIRDRYGKRIPASLKKIDKDLNDTVKVLDERLAEVEQQYARSSKALQNEAKARKLKLEEPLDEAEEQLNAAAAAFGPRPVSHSRVQEANVHLREGFESEDAYEAERATWVEALRQMRENNVPIMRRVDGRLTPETMEEIRRTAATIEPAPVVPEAAAPMTPEEFQSQLGQRMSQEPPAAAAPEPVPEPEVVAPPVAAPVDRTIKRRPDGNFVTDDGFEILNEGKAGWRIVRGGDENFGLHQTIKLAKTEVKELQETFALLRGEVLAEDVVPEVAEEVVEEVAAPAVKAAADPYHPRNVTVRQAGDQWDVIDATSGEEIPRQRFKTRAEAERAMRTRQGVVKAALTRRANKAKRVAAAAPEAVEEVAAPAATIASTPPPKAPPIKRLTKKWTKKTELDREVVVGPEGWQIEKFEASSRQRIDPETGEVVPAEVPRGTRYVAINTTPRTVGKTIDVLDDPNFDVLRGRSWPSQREAQLAVEDAMRRQKIKMTSADVLERSMGRAAPPVTSTYENLAGTLPPQAGPPPEVAAANLAAVPPTRPRPGPPSRRQHAPAEWEFTEAGQEMVASRPVPPPLTDRYKLDYQAWQAELERAMSAATEKERNAATRRATSLGGEFTQTTGKHHKRYSAENVLMEHDAWEAKKLANTPEGEAYRKAKANYDQKVVDIDNQTEAIVYIKAHNPELQQDVYTRAPDISMGFGPGEERIPVLPKPPTEGAVPTGTRKLGYEEPPQPPYDPTARIEDRAALDDPAIMDYMPPENRDRYQRLTDRSNEINFRIHVADQNQANLDRLDEAAKAAYTAEVKQADEVVKQATAARVKAEMDAADPASAMPGAAGRTEAAKRAEREAIEAQTVARQQWMAADQAWRDGLKMRDEYLKVADQVSGVERVLISENNTTGTAIIDAVKRTREVPDTVPMPQGGAYKLSLNQRKWARELIIGNKELDEARAMGMEFMTDSERRDLVGEMVSIDDTKREMYHNVQVQLSATPETAIPKVQRAKDVLPRRSSIEELAELKRPEGYETARFGETAPPPVKIPPVHGHEGLPGRAYAESFEPTQPGVRVVPHYTAAGDLIETPTLSGRVPYEPRTEREAIEELTEEAGKIKRQEKKTAAGEVLERETANIATERAGAKSRAARDKIESQLKLEIERDEALSPLGDRLETLKLVDDALNDKQKLVPLRDAAEAQRKAVVKTRPTGKKADLVRIVDELSTVAKANPDLLDDDLAVVEAMLHAARKDAETLADKDLTVKQVQGAIDGITRKGNNDLDVMLVTVGKDWRMLYEASGNKKAVLQRGDTILDAELHRMFNNIYDISKDKVLFGRTLNAFTNLFKTYATLTPGFHIRNALSAVFMNSADGVPLNTQRKAALMWREYMKAPDGEAWIKKQPQKIQDALSATYGSGAGGRFTEAGFAESMLEGGWTDWLEKAQRNRFTRLSQRAGQRVEGSVRFAMAMHSMDIGENVEAAIQRINRVHFDYSEISKMDENMKRLIPFWTFMSRNLPMQVSQMWTKPRVYEQYKSFVRNYGEENEEFTPEYWTKAGAFNTGLKVPGVVPESFGGGLPIYASPDLGFTRLQSDLKDYEDFLSWKRPGAVLSQANPYLTAPVELATRKDIFTGQTFEEGETVPVGGLNTPYKLLAGVLGQTKDGEVDAAFMNAIRAINPLTDRSTRLAPQLTGGDEEGKKRQLESIMRTMFGAPVRTLTPKQQDNEYFRRYYDQIDAAKQQQARLQRQAG